MRIQLVKMLTYIYIHIGWYNGIYTYNIYKTDNITLCRCFLQAQKDADCLSVSIVLSTGWWVHHRFLLIAIAIIDGTDDIYKELYHIIIYIYIIWIYIYHDITISPCLLVILVADIFDFCWFYSNVSSCVHPCTVRFPPLMFVGL
jgi:hypothetical protein